MSPSFKIPDHLVIPFACPKWEIEDIRITGVSTDGTYFDSETHCAYISLADQKPLRLSHFFDAWALSMVGPEEYENTHLGLQKLCALTKDFGNLQTDSERRFVDVYFAWVQNHWDWEKNRPRRKILDEEDHPMAEDANALFAAPLPLPQAHVYAKDPFTKWSWRPDRMYKLDFAFWTGQELVGVEIDGPSHWGSSGHIKKDRDLQRAGVHVVHILNEELAEHGRDAVSRLLPPTVLDGWRAKVPFVDLDSPFFPF